MTILFAHDAFERVMEPLRRGRVEGWLEIGYREPTFRAESFRRMEAALANYNEDIPIDIVHVRWQMHPRPEAPKFEQMKPYYTLDVLFWYYPKGNMCGFRKAWSA